MVIFNDDGIELLDGVNTNSKENHCNLPSTSVSHAVDTVVNLQQDSRHNEIHCNLPSTSVLHAFNTEANLQKDSRHDAINTLFKEDATKTQTRITTPANIIPLPKIKIRRQRKGKVLKSILLTYSTPNKERMAKELAEKEKELKEKK